MKEIWKSIPNWENYYEISNHGRVKSLDRYVNHNCGGFSYMKGKILKQFTIKGYSAVNLVNTEDKRKSLRIHRLIMLTFTSNPENKPCVNHLDGNTLNNSLSNLEWCTYSENEQHSFDVLGKKSSWIKRRKIPLEKVKYIINEVNKGRTQKDLAKEFNVYPSTISLLVNKKTYQYGT